MSVKNLLEGDGDWTYVKEVLGWTLDTEAGTVTLLERKLQELLTLVDILETQRWMVRKDLERLVGKLLSIHLALPGPVSHLFHIQHALTQGGMYRAWISPAFHHEIADWRELMLQAADRPRYLDKIIRHKPNHLVL